MSGCLPRAKVLRQMPVVCAAKPWTPTASAALCSPVDARTTYSPRQGDVEYLHEFGLCSLAFTAHVSLLGGDGLQHLARLNHEQAVDLAGRLSAIDGVRPVNDTFFNEFTLELPQPADTVVEALAARGVLGGVPVSRLIPDGVLKIIYWWRQPKLARPKIWPPMPRHLRRCCHERESTFTGHRGLELREDLIFEIGARDRSGVDLAPCGAA